jgi:predicted porin
MQKKLLTLAVAGALAGPGVALAQSSVEVYGFISLSPVWLKYTEGNLATGNSGAAVGSVSKFDVSSHGSNVGVRGRESLGGGLNAWFQIEENTPMARNNNVATVPASRNSALGMQGGFGNIFWGQWTTPWADLDGLWAIGHVGGYAPILAVIDRRETTGTAPHLNCTNATPSPGSSICDDTEAGGGVGHPFWRRASNMIRYDSPNFGGAVFSLLYQTNEGKQPSVVGQTVQENASMWSGSLTWSGMGGRARVGAALDRHKDFTTVGDTDTGWKLAGGWNFGVVDIGADIERMTYKCQGAVGAGAGANQQAGAWNGQAGSCTSLGATGDVKSKAYGLAASVPVGVGAVKASYAKVKALEGEGLTVPDTGAKFYTVGYVHRFSKRTELGVAYAKIKNETNATMTWTGTGPDTNGAVNGAGITAPIFGASPSVFQISMVHRF